MCVTWHPPCGVMHPTRGQHPIFGHPGDTARGRGAAPSLRARSRRSVFGDRGAAVPSVLGTVWWPRCVSCRSLPPTHTLWLKAPPGTGPRSCSRPQKATHEGSAGPRFSPGLPQPRTEAGRGGSVAALRKAPLSPAEAGRGLELAEPPQSLQRAASVAAAPSFC